MNCIRQSQSLEHKELRKQYRSNSSSRAVLSDARSFVRMQILQRSIARADQLLQSQHQAMDLLPDSQ